MSTIIIILFGIFCCGLLVGWITAEKRDQNNLKKEKRIAKIKEKMFQKEFDKTMKSLIDECNRLDAENKRLESLLSDCAEGFFKDIINLGKGEDKKLEKENRKLKETIHNSNEHFMKLLKKAKEIEKDNERLFKENQELRKIIDNDYK